MNNASMLLLRISQSTAVLMFLGWIAVVFTALYMGGGHPPLSAYVGVAVIVSSWLIGSIGVVCGLMSMRTSSASWAPMLFTALNLGLLGFAILVNFI